MINETSAPRPSTTFIAMLMKVFAGLGRHEPPLVGSEPTFVASTTRYGDSGGTKATQDLMDFFGACFVDGDYKESTIRDANTSVVNGKSKDLLLATTSSPTEKKRDPQRHRRIQYKNPRGREKTEDARDDDCARGTTTAGNDERTLPVVTSDKAAKREEPAVSSLTAKDLNGFEPDWPLEFLGDTRRSPTSNRARCYAEVDIKLPLDIHSSY